MTKVTDKYLEERRQEILDAAQKVFVEKGYNASTINDIATEAGVAAGSIYRYFANKAELISEVARCCVEEDLARWNATDPTGLTPGQAFLALGEEVRETTTTPEHREIAIMRLESYLAASRDTEIQTQISDMLDISTAALAEYIRAAQASGELDTSIDPLTFARFLHAFGSGVGNMTVLYGDVFPAAQMWELMIRFVSSSFSEEIRQQIT